MTEQLTQPAQRYVLKQDEHGNALSYQLDNDGYAYLHFDLASEWKLSTLKYFLRQWHDCRQLLKEQGHEYAFVAIPAGDSKLQKWEQLFGFELVKSEAGYSLFMREL